MTFHSVRTSATSLLAIVVCVLLPEHTTSAASGDALRASQCMRVTSAECVDRNLGKPGTPLMITPLTGVFTDEPRFEWRRTTSVDAYLLTITELNAKGAIIATFSRNITPQVECIEQTCTVSSASLGFRLQSDAARFKYRLTVSNDNGSSATPKTTVSVQ